MTSKRKTTIITCIIIVSLIIVITVVFMISITTKSNDKIESINNSNESPQDLFDEVDIGNIIFLQSDTEEELYISDGRLAIGSNLNHHLNDTDSPNKQKYAVSIKLSSNEFESFKEKKKQEIDKEYDPLFEALEDKLQQAKLSANNELFSEVEPEVHQEWERLVKNRADEYTYVDLNAIECYIKPIIPMIKELGIDIVEKKINFVQDNDILFSETYYIAYVNRHMIEQMKSFVSDKFFGIGIELAPEFVNRDSSDVDLRDPYFSNLTE